MKQIVWIRHGCTFMNEYLGRNPFGSPNFSDIFAPTDQLYFDSKLSPLGIRQSKQMMQKLLWESSKTDNSWLETLDLVAISPLTRAIQTFDIGLRPVLLQKSLSPNIVALPLATERLYLISDHGRSRSDLERDWGNIIDFQSFFRTKDDILMEEWWFGLDDYRDTKTAMSSGITSETYVEWRPSRQNQKYACPGEDDTSFENRMQKLYQWLAHRPESTIAVICHWGVIDWFLDREFRNCEIGIVNFDDLRPYGKSHFI
jgi:broad specificity phosphatase PhoE